MKIADNYKMNNVEVKPDVIDAMFRQIKDGSTKPFKKHTVPVKIFAAEYDLGRINSAYFDTDTMNLWVSDPNKNTEWNFGQQMRNDAVDIYKDSSKDFPYYVGKIEPSEWLQYTFESKKTGNHTLKIDYRNMNKPAKITIKNAENAILATVVLPINKAGSDWSTFEIDTIPLKKGENKLRFYFDDGGLDFKAFEIK